MHAEIYQPAKSAMQSGRGKTRRWRIRYVSAAPRQIDNLMGYAGAGNPERQLNLSFDSMEAAIAYAESKGLTYRVREPRQRRVPIKSYSDNFKA